MFGAQVRVVILSALLRSSAFRVALGLKNTENFKPGTSCDLNNPPEPSQIPNTRPVHNMQPPVTNRHQPLYPVVPVPPQA